MPTSRSSRPPRSVGHLPAHAPARQEVAVRARAAGRHEADDPRRARVRLPLADVLHVQEPLEVPAGAQASSPPPGTTTPPTIRRTRIPRRRSDGAIRRGTRCSTPGLLFSPAVKPATKPCCRAPPESGAGSRRRPGNKEHGQSRLQPFAVEAPRRIPTGRFERLSFVVEPVDEPVDDAGERPAVRDRVLSRHVEIHPHASTTVPTCGWTCRSIRTADASTAASTATRGRIHEYLGLSAGIDFESQASSSRTTRRRCCARS